MSHSALRFTKSCHPANNNNKVSMQQQPPKEVLYDVLDDGDEALVMKKPADVESPPARKNVQVFIQDGFQH
jgi:hypothetical protein